MQIAIIEDEPLARKELKRTLADIEAGIETVAEMATVSDSVVWLKGNPQVDLIFCDIQLADGQSFEIFRQVSTDIPLIFVTAYDEYAIKAFELNSVDYLLKPYDEVALEKALKKFKKLESRFSSGAGQSIDLDAIQKMIESGTSNKFKKRFLARVGDQYKQIPMEEVAYFYAEGNTMFLVTESNRHYILDFTLEEVSKQVDPDTFFRINRSHLVRNTSIAQIHKYFNHRLKLDLSPKPKEDILVSRARVNDFLAWLDQ
jgi:DNA-binding LytR/AlgR family response regulator